MDDVPPVPGGRSLQLDCKQFEFLTRWCKTRHGSAQLSCCGSRWRSSCTVHCHRRSPFYRHICFSLLISNHILVFSVSVRVRAVIAHQGNFPSFFLCNSIFNCASKRLSIIDRIILGHHGGRHGGDLVRPGPLLSLRK